MRELVTMIHLATFTGAPASRAEELVSQIAAAVQGLSDVALGDRNVPSSSDHEDRSPPVSPPPSR